MAFGDFLLQGPGLGKLQKNTGEAWQALLPLLRFCTGASNAARVNLASI